MVREILSNARDVVELTLLWRIWVDGRAIRAIEQATYELYKFYVDDRKAERTAKLEQLRKAREAKANKKIENPIDVEQLKKLTQENINKRQTGDLE
jgi:hypothetical protein